MRPVQRDLFSQPAAEEVVDTKPEDFGFDVKQGVFDAREGFGDDAALGLAGAGEEELVDGFVVEGVFADDERGEFVNGGFDCEAGAVGLGYFAPADFVTCGDFHEGPDAPACVTVQDFDFFYLQCKSSFFLTWMPSISSPSKALRSRSRT